MPSTSLNPTTTAAATLEVQGARKNWPSGFSLGPVSLTFSSGQTIGFFGANGAGKTTLFQLISGGLDLDAGSIKVQGKYIGRDKPQVRNDLGYLPQELFFPKWFGVADIITYAAALKNMPNPKVAANREVERWDLLEFAQRPISLCSYGTQRRVGLAIALLNNPPVALLDEPFNGLDLIHSKMLETVLRERQQAGRITLLSTHIPMSAARCCSSTFVIKKGHVENLLAWEKADLLSRVQMIEEIFLGISS